jgi:hypothetical protein
MQTAPARIINSAQTVAKIGRLMKKSTKAISLRLLSFGGRFLVSQSCLAS